MESLTLEDWRSTWNSLEEILKCLVCHNSLQPLVALCESGHSICPDCKQKISNCPLCTRPFLSVKNRQFDDMLAAFPHLCRFEECQVFVKTGQDHEKWCEYRKTDCKILDCEWNGSVKDLTKHFQKSHPPEYVMNEINEDCTYSELRPLVASDIFYNPILGFEQIFWMHTTNHNIFKMGFYCLPKENIVDTFKITVTFLKDRKEFSASILLLPENLTNEEENFICLPSSFVKTYIISDNELKYSLVIEKK